MHIAITQFQIVFLFKEFSNWKKTSSDKGIETSLHQLSDIGNPSLKIKTSDDNFQSDTVK